MSPGALFAKVRATGRLWNSLLVVLDIATVAIATVLAYYARFDGKISPEFERFLPYVVLISGIVYLTLFTLFGLYRLVLRYVGVDTLLRLFGATVIGFAALLLADIFAPVPSVLRLAPIGVLFIQAVLVFLGAAGSRMAARVYLYARYRGSSAGRRVLVVGGGSAGSLLLREIQGRPDLGLVVVGILDDEASLKGRNLGGVHVLGPTSALSRVVAEKSVDEVIVAMPSASRDMVRGILNDAADAGVQTRVMPALVIEKGSVSLHDLRSVEVEDLLGREPTPIDLHEVRETIAGKVVAVTGAAGSIGSELCRQIVKLQPSRLVLIEIDETRLYELWLELETMAPGISVMRICDIRDAGKLDRTIAAEKPQLLLHAAAYKHVPLMELAPAEAIKTNVLGTRQVIASCERNGVERFVLISTDKAVAPANIMGLTKSIAEKEMLSASRRGKLHAVAVRFGNVLASRGSVVPIFEEQLRHGGPLTVTDPEVTRYFMTIPEASRLVLQAQAIGDDGDIFVLEMGEPVKIVDLARKMIALSGVPADIEFVGLRPGEKLHEELTTQAETLLPTSREKINRVASVDVIDDAFDARLDALIEAAEADDTAGMRAEIAAIAPDFTDEAEGLALPV